MSRSGISVFQQFLLKSLQTVIINIPIFRPVTDAELQELSNVPTSVNNHNNENIPELTDSDDSRSDSDEDDGWETTEDDDEDGADNNH